MSTQDTARLPGKEILGHHRIEALAAAIPLANLDTDQIMPKQFLRGIDKSGLAQGVFHDMRFDASGRARGEFVLNQPEYAETGILLAGPNFGCGSSREHAVWGLLQFGIRAVIASSFGEIFYSNAVNNRLLLVMIPEQDVQAFMGDTADAADGRLAIDLATMTVRSARREVPFTLSRRHRDMFMKGQDLIGASLAHRDAIGAFAAAHWQQHPWLKDVAALTRKRLAEPEAEASDIH